MGQVKSVKERESVKLILERVCMDKNARDTFKSNRYTYVYVYVCIEEDAIYDEIWDFLHTRKTFSSPSLLGERRVVMIWRRWRWEWWWWIMHLYISTTTTTTFPRSAYGIIKRRQPSNYSKEAYAQSCNIYIYYKYITFISLTCRFLTYSFLPVFNAWLLICPYRLSYDWQMGSIPLVETLWDIRNIYSILFYFFFAAVVHQSYHSKVRS